MIRPGLNQMKYPTNELEVMEFLIEKSKDNPAQRNKLERYADEVGISYDRKDYEIHYRNYPTIQEVEYSSESEETDAILATLL